MTRDKCNHVNGIEGDVGACALFSDLITRGDTTRLQNYASDVGIAAFFTHVQPLSVHKSPSMPTFVVDKSYIDVVKKSTGPLFAKFHATSREVLACESSDPEDELGETVKEEKGWASWVGIDLPVVGFWRKKKIFRKAGVSDCDLKDFCSISASALSEPTRAIEEARKILCQNIPCSFDQLTVMAHLCSQSGDSSELAPPLLKALLCVTLSTEIQDFLKPQKNLFKKMKNKNITQPRIAVFRFLTSREWTDIGSSGTNSQFCVLVTLLFLCGLLNGKHSEVIAKMRGHIDSAFILRNSQDLKTWIGEKELDDMYFCFQNDLNSLVNSKEPKERPTYFDFVFTSLIDASLRQPNNVRTTWRLVIHFFAQSGVRSWGCEERAHLEKIISRLNLDPVVRAKEIVDLSTSCQSPYDTASALLINELEGMLLRFSLCSEGLDLIFTSGETWLLLSPQIESSLDVYITNAMQTWSSLGDKLRVLQTVYNSKQTSCGTKTNLLSDQVAMACSTSLHELFPVLRDNVDIFRFSETNEGRCRDRLSMISNGIASSHNIDVLINLPEMLDVEEIDSQGANLLNILIENVTKEISTRCKSSRETVCAFFKKSLRNFVPPSVQQFACNLFAVEFTKYCPDSFINHRELDLDSSI